MRFPLETGHPAGVVSVSAANRAYVLSHVRSWAGLMAYHFRVWILVRRTHRASLDYIGKPNFVAKPINAKPRPRMRTRAGISGLAW
jgi:hypothetical protein